MFIKTNFFYPVVLHYVTVFSVCFFVSMENIIALSCSRAATSLVSAWKSAMTVHSCRAEASARTASTQSECTETERKCYTTTHTHPNTLLIWLPVSMEVQYLGYHLFASLREHVSLQLGHVRGAKLPRPHVHRRARQLLQPQRMAGPEPQHPVHTPSGQLFLKSHSFDYYRPHPALMSSCSVNKLK